MRAETGLGDAWNDGLREAWLATYRTVATVMRAAAYPEYDASSYRNHKHDQRRG